MLLTKNRNRALHASEQISAKIQPCAPRFSPDKNSTLKRRFVSVHSMPSSAYSRTRLRARTNWQFNVRRQLTSTNSSSHIQCPCTVSRTKGTRFSTGASAHKSKNPAKMESRPLV